MSEDYYKKPALSYAEQLVLLKQRGLQIDNESKALHLLENISYYRLSGYWYPMLTFPKSNHLFKKGSTFENAFKLYCFDSELRKLILSELEKIEIAVRAKMIYILWHKHGPFWFTKKQLFKDGNNQEKLINILKGESERSDEEFILIF
jgi:abortive infection bacteriophage resistance protein